MTESDRRRLFNEMYAQFDRRVLAYCTYVTGDRDLAQDVFQEVFIKAYRSLHTVRDSDKMANWLFRIARNECLNAMKSAQRNERRSVPYDAPDAEARLATPPSAHDSDEHAHLRWGIEQLTPEHKEALLLAEFEGFSMKEIAEMTGATVSNVKVRIHRAKQKLYTLLHPLLNDYA